MPSIFTGIAFDSGGVASGPMTATFLLPFAQGACQAVGGNMMTDAFGIVAMVAMTPLVTIQIMGLSTVVRHQLARGGCAITWTGWRTPSSTSIDGRRREWNPQKLIVSIVERGQGAALEKLYRKNYVTPPPPVRRPGHRHLGDHGHPGAGLQREGPGPQLRRRQRRPAAAPGPDSDLRRSVKGSGLVFSLPMSGVSSLAANLAAYLADNIKPHEKEDADMERTENS